MRGQTRHHDSDRQKRERAMALRRSIGLAWGRVPDWLPAWPQLHAPAPIRVDTVRRRARS